jgi:hypothetical protein
MMTASEILNEIYKLPLVERKKVKQTLLSDSELSEQTKPKLTQAEFDQLLFDEGLLVNFPLETDEDDNFEPIKFEGKPISETIIEERR